MHETRYRPINRRLYAYLFTFPLLALRASVFGSSGPSFVPLPVREKNSPLKLNLDLPTASQVGGETWYFQALCVNISKSVPDTTKVAINDYTKLHMRFRLAPTSITLDDLERLLVRISPKFALWNFKHIR